jgi:hypothetical protein
MAKKPIGESVQELSQEVLQLKYELNPARAELERYELLIQRDKLNLLEDRVLELKRLKEEGERRHWQFVYILTGALTSLLVTVIVQLVMALLKKP